MSITARTIVSVLEIKDADMSDTGTYVCRTSNLQIKDMRVNVLNGELGLGLPGRLCALRYL